MFQSVRLSIAVAIIGIVVAVLGQLDHFLPPPPGKLKFAIPSFFQLFVYMFNTTI